MAIRPHYFFVAIFLWHSIRVGFCVQASDLLVQKRIDSLDASIDEIESKVRSTLMFGGSSPVSFSGEARLKLQHHTLIQYPQFMKNDRSWTQANWEGNESFIRLAMVVRANRSSVLWSKIGFQNTFAANQYSFKRDTLGSQVQTRHDKMEETANIHEDMCAGIAIRTTAASFWLKLGTVHWVQTSPLTIWKAQPRTFAWDYLPYEIEQPIARYYEYNIALGEKTGRAAWNKKPFNGINLESINLPQNLYVNLLYGAFERFDNFEREYVDFSNDLAYAGETSEAKGRGIGDSYRHLMAGRVAREKMFGDLIVGLNSVMIFYDPQIENNFLFRRTFNAVQDTAVIMISDPASVSAVLRKSPTNSAFYKQPKILSVDLKGDVNEKLIVQTDVAASIIDTTWIQYPVRITMQTKADSTVAVVGRSSRSVKSSPSPALFLKIGSSHWIPLTLDAAFVSAGFYSPFSFAVPADAFYPFGANLLGPGKFLCRAEASPYIQNIAGMQLTVAPKMKGYGHLKVKYGQHFQIKESRDLLFFPYRLNGIDLFTIFHSSYNRWGNGLIDHSITNVARNELDTWVWYKKNDSYQKRLADESFRAREYKRPWGPEAGGLRSDYLAMYEGFVPYEDSLSAQANLFDTTGIFTRSAFVPRHRKWTYNLECDAAYDIAPLLKQKRDILIGIYAAINGVTTSFQPLSFGDKSANSLLWSYYLRLEPSLALGERLYLIGLAGIENWRSRKAYSADTSGVVSYTPINFLDYAFGLGLDWDMLERTGLHIRAKWMEHHDLHLPKNNWSMPLISSEMKIWF